jgi:phosphatidylserine/phosphatidylglycerophosphate/cardiolipin synthase-like enzyme
MAKFLNTRKCTAELGDLIQNSDSDLTLISPYLHLPKDFKELLTYRNGKGRKTTLLFREPKLNPEEFNYLKDLHLVTLRYNEAVHAKSYFNDQRMIITSMNFYQFSMDHNKEMGVMIEKYDPADTQLFNDAMKEVDVILGTSRRYDVRDYTPTPIPQNDGNKKKGNKTASGYCIRTGQEIPFNLEKPLCLEAYKKWNKFANPNYPEKYCHFSGELSNGETSVGKPVLNKYWKKAQNLSTN